MSYTGCQSLTCLILNHCDWMKEGKRWGYGQASTLFSPVLLYCVLSVWRGYRQTSTLFSPVLLYCVLYVCWGYRQASTLFSPVLLYCVSSVWDCRAAPVGWVRLAFVAASARDWSVVCCVRSLCGVLTLETGYQDYLVGSSAGPQHQWVSPWEMGCAGW